MEHDSDLDPDHDSDLDPDPLCNVCGFEHTEFYISVTGRRQFSSFLLSFYRRVCLFLHSVGGFKVSDNSEECVLKCNNKKAPTHHYLFLQSHT